MAAALGAEYCEICSDVDGVYTADPRVVPEARRIGTLSYEETQELAESGAKVLNAQAVEFAKEKGIAIYARATARRCPAPIRRPTARSSGATRRAAGHGRRRRQRTRRARHQRIARAGDCIRARGSTPIALRLLALLDEHKVAGKQLHVAGDRLTLVVSRENLHEEARVREALAARFGGAVRIADTLGALSVVGAGINASFENVRRGSAALAADGIVDRRDRDLVVPNHLDDRPRRGSTTPCGCSTARSSNQTRGLKAVPCDQQLAPRPQPLAPEP